MTCQNSRRNRFSLLLLFSHGQLFLNFILCSSYLTYLVTANGFFETNEDSGFGAILTWILITLVEFLLSLVVLMLTHSNPKQKYQMWLICSFIATILKTCLLIYYGLQSKYSSTPELIMGGLFVFLSVLTDLFMALLLDCLPPLLEKQENQVVKGGFKRMKIIRNNQGKEVSTYYNTNIKDPVNLELGHFDGIYHHHYGIGDIDPSFFTSKTDEEIKVELHRLEHAQADFLLKHFGSISQNDRILDAGCGRGGLSVMAAEKFGCHVDAISISDYQVQFARDIVKTRGLEDKVEVHFRNMLNTKFENGTFTVVWNNESTMYVDLHIYFAELRRILEPGGRWVCITGACPGNKKSECVKRIDDHYRCRVHCRNDYLRELIAYGFTIVTVTDLTELTIPYWKLRSQCTLSTPVDEFFKKSYAAGEFKYFLIVAEKM